MGGGGYWLKTKIGKWNPIPQCQNKRAEKYK